MRQLLINNTIFFYEVAILKDGKLEEFIFEEKEKESFLGNIYKGKVENILPGIEAAFINIGLEKNAYLFKDDILTEKFLKEKKLKKKDVDSISKVLKKGEEILVQIVRDPMGEKNISVTTDISLTGKLIALIPKSCEVKISTKIKNHDERKRLIDIGKSIMIDGNGMIMRTYSKDKSIEEIQQEYELLSSIYNKIEQEFSYSYAPKMLYKSDSILDRVFIEYVDPTIDEIFTNNIEDKKKLDNLIKINNVSNEMGNIKVNYTANDDFEFLNIDKQINMLFNRKIELENGGSIFIDVTEAMTVIDVNSGKFVGNINMEETALSLNLSALEEIVRQIKLRNISGIIIIDFIDMKNSESINLLIDSAKNKFKNDKARTNVIEMTKLNLMEITRKKNKENFFNIMTDDCNYCKGGGKISSRVHILLKIEKIINNIKSNTSCEFVTLNVGNILYNKLNQNWLDYINRIEEEYNIKIIIEENNSIFTDEIVVGKMGKIPL
ncbi:MAG: Rne/Rng family ribonuclease [Tissierellia bacterium]|nr:Rne/Rng family ribonuclease [Tissierellia bacterium]